MAKKGGINNLRTPTTEVAREIGRKGGLAKAENERKRKTMREALEMIMFDVEVDEAAKDKLKAAGIDEKDFNNQMLITLGLMKKAKEGDVQAYNAICSMIGEKPADRIDLGGGMQNELRITHVAKDANDKNFPSSESEVED